MLNITLSDMPPSFFRKLSAIARKGFGEHGRGVVTATFYPDNEVIRYLPLVSNPVEGALAPALTMAEVYDPETSMVLVSLRGEEAHDEIQEAMFMKLVPSSEADLADARAVRPDLDPAVVLYMGQDESFIGRNEERLLGFAKRSSPRFGPGIVVIAREELPLGHWLDGRHEGRMPSEEASRAFYVPIGELQDVAADNLKEHGVPPGETVIMFLRLGKPTMTYHLAEV